MTCQVNTWKRQGYADGLVHPELVRRGWGLDFQLMHPDKDPCPRGWIKGEDGWCFSEEPEFEGTFYTERAHVPRYQYWNGYAPRLVNPKRREISEFDMRSVHPMTGEYVIYHHPYYAPHRGVYGHHPSKDSYLA